MTSSSGPFHYSIYGEELQSEIPFPELRERDPGGEVRWRFCLDRDLPDRPAGQELGSRTLYDDVMVRLLRGDRDVLWIVVDDSGVFRISPDGIEIRWKPRGETSWDFGRTDLMGRVLGTILHFAEFLTLHGSAVSLAHGAVAFLAPSCSGKSTLSLALVKRGGRLVADDDLIVDFAEDGNPRLRPGSRSTRLTDESRRVLGVGEDLGLNRDGKVTLTDLPSRQLAHDPVPLQAVYVLASVPPDRADATLRRVRMGGVEATLAVQGQVKFGQTLGAAEMPVLLDRVSTLVGTVPVYSLHLVRDFDRLAEALDLLLDWHPAEPVGWPDDGHGSVGSCEEPGDLRVGSGG